MDNEKLIYYLNHEEKLPPFSYNVQDVEETVIIIKNQVAGYFRTNFNVHNFDEAKQIAKEQNEKMGITEEQAKAMKILSLEKWK